MSLLAAAPFAAAATIQECNGTPIGAPLIF